jgi:DNA-binding MarR family transcriptional regulator
MANKYKGYKMATRFITVSIEIMHDNNLNQSQKFILAEIEQLSQLDKGCIASNKHFSDLIGITKENVSRNINELEKKGYISIEIVKGSRNHNRIITLTTLVRPPYQSSKTPLLKQQETKENKTINKTKNTYDAFLEYLESKVSYKTKVTKTKEGEELFKKIEDKKQLAIDYLKHQQDKEGYAVRITAYMKDYETVHKQQTINSKFGDWCE